MSDEKGYLKLYRKFFDNFLWQEKREYSKAEAWIDLLVSARYKDGTQKQMIDGKVVIWERGQLIASMRFLQTRWKWKSISRVGRFLKFLQDENMISIDTTQRIGRITICNYESYNASGDSNETAINTPKKKAEVLTFSETLIEVILSKELFSKIKERNPNHKEPNFQTWAKQIDLMIRVDKRAIMDIKNVIDWCQADSFWQNNILSTAKLRDKFDQLKIKMEGIKSGNNRVGSFKKPKGSITSDEYKRQLNEIYKQDGEDSTVY